MENKYRLSFKSMLAALILVTVTEAWALLLNNFFSNIETTTLIRSVQIILLVLLAARLPGLDNAGMSLLNLKHGIRTGVIWSLCFGAVAGVTGVVIFLTGTNPVSLFAVPLSKAHPILFPVTAILIGPVCEEIFFRSFVYVFFRRFGLPAAVVATTVLFASLHVSARAPLPWVQMVGGVVFCLAFERSKSLAAPIIIHVSGNLAIFSLAFWAGTL